MVPDQVAPGLPELLLWRGASVAGFFLLHYAAQYRQHLQKLVAAWQAGRLHVALDSQRFRCARCMRMRRPHACTTARLL